MGAPSPGIPQSRTYVRLMCMAGSGGQHGGGCRCLGMCVVGGFLEIEGGQVWLGECGPSPAHSGRTAGYARNRHRRPGLCLPSLPVAWPIPSSLFRIALDRSIAIWCTDALVLMYFRRMDWAFSLHAVFVLVCSSSFLLFARDFIFLAFSPYYEGKLTRGAEGGGKTFTAVLTAKCWAAIGSG